MVRLALSLLIILSWTFLIGAAFLQTGGGEGWPPQTELYQDARFLALTIPFLITLGVVAGIYQARLVAKRGGDAIQGDRVRRHDGGVVIAHWLNAAGIIIGLATGAILLRWIDLPSDVRTIFILHYVGAAFTIFAIFSHLTRSGVSGATGLIPRSFGVIRDTIGELLGYLGLFGPDEAVLKIPWPKAIRTPIARYAKALLGYNESRTGKYLATEKVLSYPPWAILIGAVVITGVIKTLRYVYPIPSTLVAVSTAIHDLATIGIGVMLVIHLLPLLLVPANWQILTSMFWRKLPLEYVKKRHPAWYKELISGKKEEEVVAEPVPERATGSVHVSEAD